VNKKSQITQDRLYSEDRNRKASGIMKEVAGQQTSMKKLRQWRKVANSSNPTPGFPGGVGKAEDAFTR
jgi:hypothetical protein